MVNGTIQNVAVSLSNGTVAGIPITSLDPSIIKIEQHIYTDWLSDSLASKSMSEFMTRRAHTFCSLALAHLAAQTDTRTIELAQLRKNPVVAKVPVAPLWTLVAANLTHAFFAIVFTVLAITSNSSDVSQVQKRLGILGLVAQLFESPHSEKMIEKERELFMDAEGEGESRVSVLETDAGGWKFTP